MIHQALIAPRHIAVIGASSHPGKPGGKVLLNLLRGGFKGTIYGVNPGELKVDGVHHVRHVTALPSEVDLAILSIPAQDCPATVKTLLQQGTRAFILFSAGFGEIGEVGEALERELCDAVKAYDGVLIGPNCIGVIQEAYKGVFTTPIPEYHAQGCELISSSGATAVFIMEAAGLAGLRFSNVYSIGNASVTGVEEVLAHMDEVYVHGESPPVKLLYLEHIRNPFRFLKHAQSLIQKGCRIAAIKSGSTEAGGRAASSHTGAMASSETVIRALFRKAGVVYCSSREELISIASVWQNKPLHGKRLAIITHAGGSAVMLTDTVSRYGLDVPEMADERAATLLSRLNPGSSVKNPIDFLATGTAQQLGEIIQFCEALEDIDGMVVVFGSPGLFNVHDVYDVLAEHMERCTKPIYPVLPSLINARNEITHFIEKGHVCFFDEVVLGTALGQHVNQIAPEEIQPRMPDMNVAGIRSIIAEADDGFLSQKAGHELLLYAGIPVVRQAVCSTWEELKRKSYEMRYPLVLKMAKSVHKTELGGVSLNIHSLDVLKQEYDRLKAIPGSSLVLVQEMVQGTELFAGAIREEGFGHLILYGLGGIFVEILKDMAFGLAPLTPTEIHQQLKQLKGYPILTGYRNKPGIDISGFIEVIERVSYLVRLAPEIASLDLNPIMAQADSVFCVDVRINIQK